MAQQAVLAILDGKATPATHTFTVMGSFAQAGEIVSKWMNRAASLLTGGAEWVHAYFKTKQDGAFTFKVSVVLPVTETVNTILVVTRTLRASATFEVPANASAIERKDLRVLLSSALAAPQIAASVDNGEAVYS